ncbi:MAG: HlyD family efflux transporter periplasmic adaptor subunit [Dysgonomonadaceae bacterium]|nr:HlyD family efflux transporter periplasmic adaptor subunit [Dysgonamonadaceae bacterium]HPD43671.1 HlyD family efflux transporter periplasmic adaptor subunit [Dysgonamonadaceae bacterium]
MKSNNRHSISIFLFFFFISIGLTSCHKLLNNNEYDASGTFETTEVIVSSEANGKIMSFDVVEGQNLTENQVVGYVDSTQLYLSKLQLLASEKSLQSTLPDIRKQIGALQQQIETARKEQRRVENLVKANAASQKQLDDINGQVLVLEKQLEAAQSNLESTSNSILNQNQALKIQIEQIEDQLQKCKIKSPLSGTVLVKYAEKGELTGAGKPLFKVGDLQQMILRAYVTADQVTKLKIGQEAKVYVDYGKEDRKEYDGTVSWISGESEFTPKTIQTRDERANLVYAVKINVKNDGLLKIGQYADVKFHN